MEQTERRAPDRAVLAERWRVFGRSECRGYSPLYEAICEIVADSADVLDLVAAAPSAGRRPNVLLAAAHDLVLRGTDHELRTIYDRAEAGDVVPAEHAGATFVDLIRRERDEVAGLLSFRHTNTNECGRSAVLVPALRWAAEQVGEPLALVDVGTSAGLNLRLDRYRIDYDDGRTTGPGGSPVVIECVVTGEPPIRPAAPEIVARIGLDRVPVDLEDPAEVRWLLACVWPDTGRLPRTCAALDLARQERVEVVAGDAVEDLARTIGRLPPEVAVAVTTSWVLAYLRPEERERFVEQLATLSHERPIVWISAEGAGVAPGIETPRFVDGGPELVELSVLGGSVFRHGVRDRSVALGRCHPHGRSLHWTAGGDTAGGAPT